MYHILFPNQNSFRCFSAVAIIKPAEASTRTFALASCYGIYAPIG